MVRNVTARSSGSGKIPLNFLSGFLGFSQVVEIKLRSDVHEKKLRALRLQSATSKGWSRSESEQLPHWLRRFLVKLLCHVEVVFNSVNFVFLQREVRRQERTLAKM